MSTVKPAVKSRGGEILKRLQSLKRPLVVEVGVATGNLSAYLLQSHRGITIYMVDNWLVEAEQPEDYRATGDTNAHVSEDKQRKRKAEAEAVAGKYKRRAKIIEANSVQAAGLCPDNVDMVFIDADHSYTGAKADIAAWVGKVKPGGWLGGHDYANTDPRFAFGVKQAVDEIFENVKIGANFTWWVRV